MHSTFVNQIVSTSRFSGEKNHKCPTCFKSFRVRGDLKRHLKIHLRLIEKEQTQKIKDEADSMAIYNEDCNNKLTSNNDPSKPNVTYGDAANSDIYIETSSLLNEVAATATTNNNIENTSFRSPRKRKSKSTLKPKKAKAQENIMSVLQLPSTIGRLQNSETSVTTIPGDISKMLPKPQKVDGIAVSVSDEQYQIYLLGT